MHELLTHIQGVLLPYLNDIAIGIQSWVPLKLDYHRLYQCRELSWRSPVLRSLIWGLHGCS